MTTAQQVYERQADLDEAREEATETYEQIAWDADYRLRGDSEWLHNHPANRANRERVEALAAIVSQLQEEIGGKVYRILAERVPVLEEKVAKLNRRAARLGVDPIELRATDEVEYEERSIRDPDFPSERISITIQFVYIVLRGSTPKLNGWIFIAALDHTDTEVEGRRATIVSRIPADAFALRYMTGLPAGQAAEVLASINLDEYRFSANKCDHCNTVRNRAKTYIVVHEAGEKKQVGSNCIKDFLGGADPHAMARFAELVFALDEEMDEKEESSNESYGSGSRVYSLHDFTTRAAALARTFGYQSSRTEWGDRNPVSTAAVAQRSMILPKFTVVVDRREVTVAELIEDRDVADVEAAIKWVREEIAAKGAAMSEFDHNLLVYATGDWVSSKGLGFVAYLPTAYRREVERRLAAEAKAKAAAESDYVGEIGARVRLALKVLGIRTIENAYGTTFITKMVDADGNRFLWFASSELEPNKTYTMTATIKNHEEDRYEGGARTTKIANCRKVEETDALPETAAVEVVASAEERALAKEARETRDAARRVAAMNDQLDGLIAAYNDVSNSLSLGWYDSGEERRELEESRARLAKGVTALEERIAELHALV